MKKVFILIIAFMFFLPIGIKAQTYDWVQAYNQILEPGDVIDFETQTDSWFIYLDDALFSSECYGSPQNCNKLFTVEERMIGYNYDNGNLYFYKLNQNPELFSFDDNATKEYYKSGDVILFSTNYNEKTAYFYDDEDNLIKSSFYGNSGRSMLYKLPKIKEKDVYWKMSFIDAGIYNVPCPHFVPFDYIEPKIELMCDKNSLNFGDKAKCEISLECKYKISNIDFSINYKQLKISNMKYLGVTNTSTDDDSFSLVINDNNICQEKKTIMAFDVEGKNDDTYLDTITLSNIEYIDEIVKAKYSDLDSDVNIVSTKPTIFNPETRLNLIFIIIPILLLFIVGTLSIIITKKKTTNN